MSDARPLILGHRGSSALAPENTLAAFARAIADGADGFEFDVRLSSDGIPVVIHDSTLKRTGSDPRRVSDLTATELQTINVGSWFSRAFPKLARPEYRQQTVPLLSHVFELVAGARKLLYVEMKCEPDDATRLAEAVASLINEYENRDQVVVESFDLNAIREIKSIDERIPHRL